MFERPVREVERLHGAVSWSIRTCSPCLRLWTPAITMRVPGLRPPVTRMPPSSRERSIFCRETVQHPQAARLRVRLPGTRGRRDNGLGPRCASQVWLTTAVQPNGSRGPILTFRGDSATRVDRRRGRSYRSMTHNFVQTNVITGGREREPKNNRRGSSVANPRGTRTPSWRATRVPVACLLSRLINQSISSYTFLLTGHPCANCKTTQQKIGFFYQKPSLKYAA